MRTLFIYWKVSPEQMAPALAATRALQTRWRQHHPALAAELYIRADGDDGGDRDGGLATVMETYAQPGGLDEPTQQMLIDDSRLVLGPWCSGGRHVEHFDRLPP